MAVTSSVIFKDIHNIKIEDLRDLIKSANAGDKESQFSLGLHYQTVKFRDPKKAILWFSKAAVQGHVLAKHYAAMCYFKGEGVSSDAHKAIRLLKACYAAGDKSVLEDLNTIAGKFVSGTTGIEKDLKTAVEVFTFAARAQHSESIENLALLGIWFYTGKDPYPKDIQQGIELLKITAKLGSKKALYNLGVVAVEVLKTDPKTGFEMLSLASELGELQSKRNVASCYFNGEGVPTDAHKAVRLLKECYTAGDKSVLEDLNTIAGKFVSGTTGIEKDLKTAVEVFTFAARAQHSESIENLALLGIWFYTGKDPYPKDIQQGIELLKITAKLGSKKALHNLGAVAVEVLKTDPKIAFEILTLASELGDAKSKRNVAVCYFNDVGVPINVHRAIGLLRECYEAGNTAVLEDFNNMAAKLLNSDKDGKTTNLVIQILAYAARHGYKDACENLQKIANLLLGWQKSNYGIQKNIKEGLKVLHYLANILNNQDASEQLIQIRALNIPVPMPLPAISTTKPSLVLGDLPFFAATPEEPHSPCTAEFLRENNISLSSKSGLSLTGPSVFSSEIINTFKRKRNEEKRNRFIGVTQALDVHPILGSGPIQETICGYLQDELSSAIFFQYRNALKDLDKAVPLDAEGRISVPDAILRSLYPSKTSEEIITALSKIGALFVSRSYPSSTNSQISVPYSSSSMSSSSSSNLPPTSSSNSNSSSSCSDSSIWNIDFVCREQMEIFQNQLKSATRSVSTELSKYIKMNDKISHKQPSSK